LKWPLVAIGELCVIERGASPRPIHDFITNAANGVNWIKIGDAEIGAKYITSTKERITPEGATKSRRVKPGDFVLSNSMSFGRPYIMATDGCIHDGWLLLRDQSEQLDQDFLYSILGSRLVYAQFEQAATGGVVNNLNSEIVRQVNIPLPPLDVQKEIVAEIEGYQKVITGARAVIDNYHPHIPIKLEWPQTTIGECCEVKGGKRLPMGAQFSDTTTDHPYIRVTDLASQNIDVSKLKFISKEIFQDIARYTISSNDVYISIAGTIGLMGTIPDELNGANLTENAAKIIFDSSIIDRRFLSIVGNGASVQTQIKSLTHAAGVPKLALERIKTLKFPLPPIAIQQAIVAEIEAEQALVAANQELIARLEKKIQTTLDRVWGED
jgi:type I restriction enzyme M protein